MLIKHILEKKSKNVIYRIRLHRQIFHFKVRMSWKNWTKYMYIYTNPID